MPFQHPLKPWELIPSVTLSSRQLFNDPSLTHDLYEDKAAVIEDDARRPKDH